MFCAARIQSNAIQLIIYWRCRWQLYFAPSANPYVLYIHEFKYMHIFRFFIATLFKSFKCSSNTVASWIRLCFEWARKGLFLCRLWPTDKSTGWKSVSMEVETREKKKAINKVLNEMSIWFIYRFAFSWTQLLHGKLLSGRTDLLLFNLHQHKISDSF